MAQVREDGTVKFENQQRIVSSGLSVVALGDEAISWRWRWGGFGLGEYKLPDSSNFRMKIKRIPYWSLVWPLTMLSAYLILFTPRIANRVNSATSPSPNTGTNHGSLFPQLEASDRNHHFTDQFGIHGGMDQGIQFPRLPGVSLRQAPDLVRVSRQVSFLEE